MNKNLTVKFAVNSKWLLLLLILSFVSLVDLHNAGYFKGHDTADHIARIANFYQNLQEGNLIPRWAENLNWGYGHPILMFLYPLSSYAASLFHALGFSLVNSTKLVFALGFSLSGITMYLWVREMWGEKAGFLAGILYLYAPYRFIDLYVRGAIGENFFFIWPPLVFYFLLKLSKNLCIWYLAGAAVSMAFMILSHNALSIMFFPFIGMYCLIVFVFSARRDIKRWLYASTAWFLGFSLSAFFWVPAFLEGRYTLRDIVTKGEILTRFEPFSRLLYSAWNYGGTGQMSVMVGVAQWAMVLAFPLLLYCSYKAFKAQPTSFFARLKAFLKDKDKDQGRHNLFLLIISIVFFFIALFMIVDVSKPLYETITVLQKFQFPWRWLSLAIVPPAIFAGYLIFMLPKKYKTAVVIAISALSIVVTKNYWQAAEYVQKPDEFFESVYEGTTDTGESAPIWSVRFMLEKPAAFSEIVEGEGNIQLIDRKITSRKYFIEVKSEQARVLENTLYFPGWFVYIDEHQLPLSEVSWQDTKYRGLITYTVSKGKHTVQVRFTDTKVRLFANLISLTSWSILLGVSVYALSKNLYERLAKKA